MMKIQKRRGVCLATTASHHQCMHRCSSALVLSCPALLAWYVVTPWPKRRKQKTPRTGSICFACSSPCPVRLAGIVITHVVKSGKMPL